MGVSFDRARAVLELGPGYFDTLLDIHRAPRAARTDPRIVGVLADAGVLEQSRIHPRLRAGLAAALADRARLRLQLATPQGRLESSCWMLGADAGWLDGDPDDACTFQVLPVDRVPVRLVELIGLGPRPALGAGQVGAAAHTRRQVIDALLGGTPPNRQQGADMLAHRAPAAWGSIRTALREGRWRAWHAETVWYPPREQPGQPWVHGRGVVVVDTAYGMVTAEPEGGGIVFLPATPAEVFRRILRLLPPEDDIPASGMGPATSG